MVLEEVLRRDLDGKKRGLTWRRKESLEGTDYADNICFVYHKCEYMQEKLNDLWGYLRK